MSEIVFVSSWQPLQAATRAGAWPPDDVKVQVFSEIVFVSRESAKRGVQMASESAKRGVQMASEAAKQVVQMASESAKRVVQMASEAAKRVANEASNQVAPSLQAKALQRDLCCNPLSAKVVNRGEADLAPVFGAKPPGLFLRTLVTLHVQAARRKNKRRPKR